MNFGGMTYKCANYIAEINCLLYFTGCGEPLGHMLMKSHGLSAEKVQALFAVIEEFQQSMDQQKYYLA